MCSYCDLILFTIYLSQEFIIMKKEKILNYVIGTCAFGLVIANVLIVVSSVIYDTVNAFSEAFRPTFFSLFIIGTVCLIGLIVTSIFYVKNRRANPKTDPNKDSVIIENK